MPCDIFMKLEGVDGESKDSTKAGETDIHTFSWGVHNSADMSLGGGGGQGKASFSEISFSKNFCKASPVLAQKCAQGTHIPSAVFTFRKSGDKPVEYKIITLTDVMVTSVNHSAGSGGEISESVSFGYAKIETKYKEQLADGSPGGKSEFTYDIKQNKGV